jgi:hypothetical protein
MKELFLKEYLLDIGCILSGKFRVRKLINMNKCLGCIFGTKKAFDYQKKKKIEIEMEEDLFYRQFKKLHLI